MCNMCVCHFVNIYAVVCFTTYTADAQRRFHGVEAELLI
jgi:hypothetical protein